MALSYINAAKYGNTSSNSAVVNKPTDTADGDIMFAVLVSNTAYANSIPVGWNLIGKDTSTNYSELYWKIASSEGADYTFGYAASQSLGAFILTFRGNFRVTDPINASSNTAYTASDTINRAASMTVSGLSWHVIFFGIVDSTGATQLPPTTPTVFTEHFDDRATAASSLWLEVSSVAAGGDGGIGNIDSTINTTTIKKHAFAVNVNLTFPHTNTQLDATATSDSTLRGVSSTMLEIITLTDIYSFIKSLWKNITKNISTWINQDKS